MEFFLQSLKPFLLLKVLSYWNLNKIATKITELREILKVLSYWNLNELCEFDLRFYGYLKVLSYWNLNLGVNMNISYSYLL